MAKTLLVIEVEYDPATTDPEALASAADTLLGTALSTPGILDEYGTPQFEEFLVATYLTGKPTAALCAFLQAEIHNCTAPNGSGEPTTLATATGSMAQMPNDVVVEVVGSDIEVDEAGEDLIAEMVAAELQLFRQLYGDDCEMQQIIDLADGTS
jgi:hypothetical protein